MPTTVVFVELIVIGVGALSWLVFFSISAFGYAWLPALEASSSSAVLGLALVISYMLGIIVDRVADGVFSRWSSKIRQRFYSTADEYHMARTLVYQKTPFRDIFEYGRSRLRIVRGWTINASLLVVSTNLLIGVQFPGGVPRFKISLFASVSLAFLVVGNMYAWHRLTTSQIANVKRQEIFLKQL